MIAACLKWVTGASGDERFAVTSAADQSALELALRHGELLGQPVTAITLGPATADACVTEAVACGATRGVRVEAPTSLDSADVARLLAAELAEATYVWCGDYSADRGTGSVPAFLAAQLDLPQALGCLRIELAINAVSATRRLDGGRREMLSLPAGGVISVEGATASLRRAPLSGMLRRPVIDVVAGDHSEVASTPVVSAYRPRPRVLPAPVGEHPLDRLRRLTDATSGARHGVTIDVPVDQAVDRIVAQLTDWGY